MLADPTRVRPDVRGKCESWLPPGAPWPDCHRCPHDAAGIVCAPDGKPISRACTDCGEAVVTEYRTKLGEAWTFRPFRWSDSA